MDNYSSDFRYHPTFGRATEPLYPHQSIYNVSGPSDPYESPAIISHTRWSSDHVVATAPTDSFVSTKESPTSVVEASIHSAEGFYFEEGKRLDIKPAGRHSSPHDRSSGGRNRTKRPLMDCGGAVPPTLPTSPYILFVKSLRDKNLEAVKKRREKMMNLDTLLKTVDSQWNVLSSEKRETFEKLAAKDAARYQRELEEYKAEEYTAKREKSESVKEEEETTSLPGQTKRRWSHTRKLGDARMRQNSEGSATPPATTSATSAVNSSQTSSFTNPNEYVQTSREEKGNALPPYALHPGTLTQPDPSLKAAGGGFHLLEGMEVELSYGPPYMPIKRKYRVRYNFVTMTKKQAEEYIQGHSNHQYRSQSKSHLSSQPGTNQHRYHHHHHPC